MITHCPTCTCERSENERVARERRQREEREAADRKEREREFAARHSVLSDDDLAWARSRLPGNVGTEL